MLCCALALIQNPYFCENMVIAFVSVSAAVWMLLGQATVIVQIDAQGTPSTEFMLHLDLQLHCFMFPVLAVVSFSGLAQGRCP